MKRGVILGIVIVLLIIATDTTAIMTYGQDPPPMAIYAPDRILWRAERSGLWSPDIYPLDFDINPFYLRGDFNGDGENDLAFWVREEASGKKGIIIIHSTLDSLYVFGAGRHFTDWDRIDTDTWNVISKGTIFDRLWRSEPELGIEEGKPFQFENEAVSPTYIAKSSFAIYWKDGKYYRIPLAD